MAFFLAVAAVASALLTIHFHDQGAGTVAALHGGPATHAVIFIVDGANGATFRSGGLPNVSALEADGVAYTRAWIGQEETAPAASAATIATGSFPRVHGVIGDVWYDSSSKTVVRPTLAAEALVGSLDQVMEPTGVGSIAAEVKARQSKARVLSVAGSNCGAAAAAGTWVADFVVCAKRQARAWVPVAEAGHALPASASPVTAIEAPVAQGSAGRNVLDGWKPGGQDDWVARETVSSMRATHPSVTFVTFPELALAQEANPRQLAPGETRGIVSGIDTDIGRIVAAAKHEGTYKSTVFVVTSGRTFETVRTEILRRKLSNAIVAAGGEPTYIAGDATAFVGLRDPLQAQPVAQALQAAGTQGIDALYYKATNATSVSYAPQFIGATLSAGFAHACAALLSTLASRNSPDVVIVYAPFTALKPATGAAESAWSGIQWGDQSVPLIIAGPGTYAGKTSTYPARLVDVAPTVEAALGLQPQGNGAVLPGTLYATSIHASASLQRDLTHDVEALQQRPATR